MRFHPVRSMLAAVIAVVLSTMSAAAAAPAVASSPSTAMRHDPVVSQNALDELRYGPSAAALPAARTAPLPLRAAATPRILAVTPPPSPFHREVFGFAPYWALGQSSQWDFRLLTTVAYFGLTLTRDGTIDTGVAGYSQWNSQPFTDMVNAAHAKGDRVVVVVKQFNTEGINRVVTDPALTQVAVTNIVNAIAAKNLDGVNIDFEGQGPSSTYPYIQSGLVTFMGTLSTQVHARWPSAEVSIDTYSGSASWTGGLFNIGQLAPVVDAMFIMAYDMPFDNFPGHAAANAPMTGYTYNDTLSVSQYLSMAPASKIILGVPFYGYKWSTTGNGPNAPGTGATADTYANIVQEIACHPQYLASNWDSTAQSPWLSWYSPAANDPCEGNHGSWRELYYDNAASLGLKFDLVNQSNLRGAGVWALGYEGGATEIWNSIAQKLTTVTVWDTLGGSTTSDAGAAWSGANEMDVVVRNGVNGLSANRWDGTKWLGWQSLGGSLASSPDAASGAANRVDVFVTGYDTAVYHKVWDGTTWLPWENLGGNVASGPAAASWAANRVDVFVVGVDARMYHRFWNGSAWSPWESLGGVVASDPAAVTWGPNRLDIVVRGTDNRLYHKAWDGVWHPWESLGGDLISNPAIASCTPGKLDVFSVGRDRALWRRGWDGTSWTPWINQGGQWAGGPSATCQPGTNTIDVFERGQDTAAWHTTVAST